MKFPHQVVKELSMLMSRARIKIRDTKDVSKNLKKLKWSSNHYTLKLEDYDYHYNDFCNTPNTIDLDIVIAKLTKLVKSKSRLINYDELKSDLSWLKKYYKEQSWNDVTRWLTNIDSTLRELFSSYIETIKALKKARDKKKDKTKILDNKNIR